MGFAGWLFALLLDAVAGPAPSVVSSTSNDAVEFARTIGDAINFDRTIGDSINFAQTIPDSIDF